MKIMRLASGLGNSMFQYAAYLQLKRLYPKEKIYVDTIWYDYTGYPYELDRIFHLNTDKVDFHKLLERKYNISFEADLEKLRYWKDLGYARWIDMENAENAHGNYLRSQLSFVELPQLYLPYVNNLSICQDMQLTIQEFRNKLPNYTEYDLLNYKGKLVNQITSHYDNIAVKYLLACLMPSKRRKIIWDLSRGRKPDLTDYPSITGLKQEGNVYFNKYGNPDNTIGVKQQIYKAFTFPELNSRDLMNWAEVIRTQESVAMHVRAGSNGYFMQEPLKRKYYIKAVAYLRKTIKRKIKFCVFSDDLAWCRKNLQLLGIDSKADEVYFIKGGAGNESYRDMQLISMCKHAVILASTFAWWGAYLIRNPSKIVVTPYGTFPGTISF